jgi:pimeloyl-ACP methyl ester carboxylesterase
VSGSLQIADRVLDVWGGRLKLHVKTFGRGRPLVFLHPAGGLNVDPFLGALGEQCSVFAPEVPGTSAGDPDAIHQIDGLSDLVLIYEEAIRALDLPAAPVVIGASFGGMLAAETASWFPQLFAKVVLIDPIGLWRPELPIANWMTTPVPQLPALLFKDPDCPAARAAFTPPADPAQLVSMISGRVWAMACTGKFVWPIPEKGLRKRLHRITAPTLIVWGEDDALVPAGYAHEFGAAIAGSRVEIVANAGHVPHAEQTETTLALVRDFLGGI